MKPVDDPKHRFKVPHKREHETYQQKVERVAAHNYNFLKNHEQRMKEWKGPGKPPIYKDKDGAYHWLNRSQRRKIK